MPGRKDTVSVVIDGVRQNKQKHLILCTLKEAYASFKEQFPNDKIGFSKFAELRPKECVLPGSAGTHSVCVCTTHQNMKLMFIGSNIEVLTKDTEMELSSPQDCLIYMQCNPPSKFCYLGLCEECCGEDRLKTHCKSYLFVCFG